jgi:GAF domain-containing protein
VQTQLELSDYVVSRTLEPFQGVGWKLLTRKLDGKLCLGKYAVAGGPLPPGVLDKEQAILRHFGGSSFFRPIELVRGSIDVLVLEYSPYVTLPAAFGGAPLDSIGALEVACALAESLATLHRYGSVLGGLCPNRVWIEPRQRLAKIADLSPLFCRDILDFDTDDPSKLRDVLPYVAPECSGRTGHSLDQRSDLYSLGIILYELLTGTPPFLAERGAELLHAHATREVELFSDRKQSIPEVVSDLVLRLLAKQPEHRYQSARGLIHDLELCRTQLLDAPHEPITLGTRDRGGRLRACTTMHGRDWELAQWQRNQSDANGLGPSFCLIRGGVGTGKSMFVNRAMAGSPELAPIWVFANEMEESGPCDLLRRIGRGIVQTCLSLPERELNRVRDRFAKKVAPVLVPDSALSIDLWPLLQSEANHHENQSSGSSPAAQHGSSTSFSPHARNSLAIARMLEIMASESQDRHATSHPKKLAVVIEQGEKIDDAEITDFVYMFTCISVVPMHLTWVERCTAPRPRAALAALVAQQRALGRPVLEISLGPLSGQALESMMADMLEKPSSEVGALARCVARRSGGNPLVVGRFLTLIEQLGLLRFETESGWSWITAEIESVELPDDVASAFTETLRIKPARIRRELALAACLGPTFEIQELLEIGGGEGLHLRGEIRSLVDEGLLVEVGRAFRFAHPFLRETATELLGAEGLREIHLQIARRRLKSFDQSLQPLRVYDVVDHLNAAAQLIDESERELALKLNLEAGSQLVRKGERVMAERYLESAWSFLVAGDWEERHELAWAIGLEVLASRMASPRPEEAREILACLSAKSANEQTRMILTRVELQLALLSTIDLNLVARSRTMLARNGFWRGIWYSWIEIGASRFVQWYLGRRLLHRLPKLESLEGAAASHSSGDVQNFGLLLDIHLALRSKKPVQACGIRFEMVREVLEHGLLPGAAVALTVFAVESMRWNRPRWTLALVAAIKKWIDESKIPAWEVPLVRLEMAMREAWLDSMAKSRTELERAKVAAQEVGDFATQANALLFRVAYGLQSGEPLLRIEELLENGLKNENILAHQPALAGLRYLAELVQRLRSTQRWVDLSSFANGLLQGGNRAQTNGISALDVALISVAQMALALGEARLAQKVVSAVLPRSDSFVGTYLESTLVFVSIAVAAELGWRGPAHQRKRCARRVQAKIRELGGRMPRFGKNFESRRLTLSALVAVLHGRHDRALEMFLRASEAAASIDSLVEQIFIERLRFELALHVKLPSEAARNAERLRGLLRNWGAQSLAQHLDHRLTQALAEHMTATQTTELKSLQTLRRRVGDAGLDVGAILRLVQAVSAEVDPQRAVAQVLATGIEVAVAERGALVLGHEQHLSLEAEAHAGRGRDCVFWGSDIEGYSEILPLGLIRHVYRTGRTIHFSSADPDRRFTSDAYFRTHATASASAIPIARQGQVSGVLYFENARSPTTLSPQQQVMLEVIGVQAAIALENARINQQLRASRDLFELRAIQQTRASLIARAQSEHAERARARVLLALEHDVRSTLSSAVSMIQEVAIAATNTETGLSDVREHAQSAQALATMAALAFDRIVQRPVASDAVMLDFSLEPWLEEIVQQAAAAIDLPIGEWAIDLSAEARDQVVVGDPRGAQAIMLEVMRVLAHRTRRGDILISAAVVAQGICIEIRDHGKTPTLAEIEALIREPVGRLVAAVGGGLHEELSFCQASKMAANLGVEFAINEGPSATQHQGCVVTLVFPWRKAHRHRVIRPVLRGYALGVLAKNPRLITDLRCAVRRLGAEVRAFASIPSKKDAATALEGIDVVLVDTNLEGLEHDETQRWLEHSTLPIVVLRQSDAKSEVHAHEAWQRGRPIVGKPIARHALSELLCGILAPDGVQGSKARRTLIAARTLVLASPVNQTALSILFAGQIEQAIIETSIENWSQQLERGTWDLVVVDLGASQACIDAWLRYSEQPRRERRDPPICLAFGRPPQEVVFAHLHARGMVWMGQEELSPSRLRAMLVQYLEPQVLARRAA